jgi:hypothetical protein
MDTALPPGTKGEASNQRPSRTEGIDVPKWSFETTT